jgi:hypothetical protein
LSGVRLLVCPSVNFYISDFFSRTTGPILTRFGTNHCWGKGIHIYSKEGDNSSSREDNIGRVKYTDNEKKIFSRTNRPILLKLGTSYLWVRRIHVYSNEGPGPLQRGDNHKNVKMGWVH